MSKADYTYETYFVHSDEKHDQTIDPSSPYTIFEPYVEAKKENGEISSHTAEEILNAMSSYVGELEVKHDFKPGGSIGLGSGKSETIGEILDSQAQTFLAALKNDQIPKPHPMSTVLGFSISDGSYRYVAEEDRTHMPDVLPGIILAIARIAEKSGFDRSKATMISGFYSISDDGTSFNHNLHLDGLSSLVTEVMIRFGGKLRLARFIYPVGPGSLLYPDFNGEGYYADRMGRPLGNPTYEDVINAPRIGNIPEEEVMNVNAQQVLPGRILGFDPTRRFWHQAPLAKRVILVTDVYEIERFY